MKGDGISHMKNQITMESFNMRICCKQRVHGPTKILEIYDVEDGEEEEHEERGMFV